MDVCKWAMKSEADLAYHNNEWGLPSYDESYLFEQLMLECQVAGLSWSTILSKRENFRQAFDNFDPVIMSQYDESKRASLMEDKGIIRHRLKINAMIANAQAYLVMKENGLSFVDYFWSFTDGQVIDMKWTHEDLIPSKTELSDLISKDLKKRGFKFVGSVTVYAFLQAVGIVNDHLINCNVRRNYE